MCLLVLGSMEQGSLHTGPRPGAAAGTAYHASPGVPDPQGRPAEAVTHMVATLDRKPTEGDSHGAEARAGGLEVRETSLQSLYCVLIVLEEHPSGTKLLGERFSVSLWRAHFVSP